MLPLVPRVLSAMGARLSAWRAMASARSDTARILASRQVRRVLVVCYGNICRSPFVAIALKKATGGGIEVRSSGFHGTAGRSSPARHIAMSRRLGVDLSGHRSSVLTNADLDWADIIVLMDRHNWQALRRAGASADRLVWLGTLEGDRLEIPDPYAMDEAAAAQVLRRLQACTARLAALVTRHSGASPTRSLNDRTADDPIRDA